MRSLAGIVSACPPPELAERVAAMCAIQKHRGVSETGIAALSGACFGRNLLPRGGTGREAARPTTREPERLCIVFDGVLFRRNELARALSGGADGDARESDDSLVLRSYVAWGADCAKHLDGIFSFAIWNGIENVLYAARDRLGEKPFYYHASPRGEFVFASEIKGVLKSGIVPTEPDVEAIYHYLHEKGFQSPRTPLASVKSLEPGCRLEYRAGAVKTTRYWDVPFVAEKIDDEEYVLSRSSELLCEAVAERIAGTDAPGLLFSGGVDSSLLLGIIAHVSGKRISTFTISTGTPQVPLALSRQISSQFNTTHAEIELDAAAMADSISDLVWYLSAPTVHSILAYFCCREALKQDLSTIFSGHMADSVFQAEWFARLVIPVERCLAPFRLIPEPMREKTYDISERLLRKAAEKRRNRFERYRGLAYEYFRYKRGISKWYGSRMYPDEIARLFSPTIDRSAWSSPADIYRDLYRKSGSTRIDERTGYYITRGGAGPSALINYESIGAAFAMQMQTPYMDQQIVEFSRRIPFNLRGKNNSEKYILRMLCSRFVSHECALQQKASFVLPFDGWLRSNLWPIVEETLSRESIERRGIFDSNRIAALCAAYRNRSTHLSWTDIWAFVVLEIWFRAHCDPRGEDLAHPSSDWIRSLIPPSNGRGE